MHPSELTRQDLIKWGGEAVYLQAERLVKSGAVLQAEMKDGWITGTIARDTTPVTTRLRVITPERIDSKCPCFANQRNGQVCHHVVALGIVIMMRHSDPLREQKYQEDKRRAQRMMSSPVINNLIRRDPHGKAAHLVFVLPENWHETFWTGPIHATLLFAIDHQLVPLEKVPRTIAYALSDADDALLSVVEDIDEGAVKSQLALTPFDFLNVLGLTHHMTIQVGPNHHLNVAQHSIPGGLQVRLNQATGELTVTATAHVPEPVASAPLRFFAHNKQALVVVQEQAYFIKVEHVLPIPHHPLYQNPIVIPRDHVIDFVQKEITTLATKIPVDMDVTPDLFSVTAGMPQFCIELRGSAASLRAVVTAQYGAQAFNVGIPPSQSTCMQPDPDDILHYITRNPQAERTAIKQIKSYRFEEDAASAPYSFTLVGVREVLNFLGTGLPTLRRSGWKFKLTDKLEALLDETPFITPVVKITEKSAQAFEVGYTFELPNNQGCIAPAEISRAINRGDAHIQINQQTYLVDRDAIESMHDVFRDCVSRASNTPGRFQLSSLYAPFVQASLHGLDGMDLEEPPHWRDKAEVCNRTGSAQLRPVPLGSLETTLRPYQKEGVYWLRFIEETGMSGILADEMGLGKTLQTLTWLNLPRTDKQAQGKPALIVCPTSLVENWNREAEKFVPHLKRVVISGADRQSRFSEIASADIVITSYALLRRDLEAYHQHQFAVAVLDEAQHIKNRSTQNAVAAKQINAVNKLVLTGTPLENSVADLWSIMDFLLPQYLGDYDTFKLTYEVPIENGDMEAYRAQEKLSRKLHPFLLRRLKKDVAKDLPDKIVNVRYCTLTQDQQRVYNTLLAESRQTIKGLVDAKGFDRSRFEILTILMRLRQICCHLDLLTASQGKKMNYAEPSAKLDAFMDILDEAIDGGHRILVFSQFVGMLKVLRETFEKNAIPYCYLDGSTQDRMAQCQRFNTTPSIPVFLISLKAGGTGLNLTGADMVVHFDPWWNPAVEDQATDRAHRIGQKRTVHCIKLITEQTVEEKVLAMQKKKQAVIDATLGASDEAIMKKLSFDDIRDLIGL